MLYLSQSISPNSLVNVFGFGFCGLFPCGPGLVGAGAGVVSNSCILVRRVCLSVNNSWMRFFALFPPGSSGSAFSSATGGVSPLPVPSPSAGGVSSSVAGGVISDSSCGGVVGSPSTSFSLPHLPPQHLHI